MTSAKRHCPLGLPEWDRKKPTYFWAWALRSAPEDGRGLRRWKLWIWWSRPRSPIERLRIVAALAIRPFSIVLDSFRGVVDFGEKVRDLHGVSPLRQLMQMLILGIRCGVQPVTYYKFKLFEAHRYPLAIHYQEDAGKFLQVIIRSIPLHRDTFVFVDKSAFESWCNQRHLPTVPIILVAADGGITRCTEAPFPQTDLFSKPTNLRSGKGVARWRHELRDGQSVWLAEDDTAYTEHELIARLIELSREFRRPLILQPLIRAHEIIHKIAPGGLSTVRFMTTRDGAQPVRPLLAVLRLPTGESIADNFDLGGLAVPIDLKTGTCGDAVGKRGQYPLATLTSHPDTGVLIPGTVLPHWSACVALALRAHDELETPMPVIGWDIAILQDGPILIESNHLPCGNLAQMPSGQPLGNTDFAPCVIRRLKTQFELAS